jgi:hypothetical protein
MTREARGSVVLKIIIVMLTAVLVYVIYEPYQIKAKEEFYQAESRSRMVNIRAAQLLFIAQHGRYVSTLDSLVMFIEALPDSVRSTAFTPPSNAPFTAQALLRTPKSNQAYVLVSIDTSAIKKYLLQDPDGYGTIGSLTDDARVNKASWED